jgi:hypothetical protein
LKKSLRHAANPPDLSHAAALSPRTFAHSLACSVAVHRFPGNQAGLEANMFGRALVSRIAISLALVGAGGAYAGLSGVVNLPSPSATAEPSLLMAAVPFASVRAPLTGGTSAAMPATLLSPLSTLPLTPMQDRPIASMHTAIVR